jgi:hypothetical protein
MAKSQSLNIIIGADIQNLKKGLDAAVVATQKAGKDLSGATGEAIKGMQDQFAKLAASKPSMATVRQMQNIAMTARSLGPEFQQFANEVIKEAGRIKDSVGDMRAEIGYFASDTRRLDAVLGGVQGLAGAFSAVEGAAALMGIESKDLQKTMVQLQGALALVNGLQALQSNLQAESAFMVGLNTAAMRIQTYVMGQATVAARVYAGALIATGAGAILVAIGLIASAFSNVKDKTKDTTKAVNTLTEAYNKQAESSKEASKNGMEIADQLLKKELDAAKLRGASDKEQTQIEIAFWQKRKSNLESNLAGYDKYSAQYLQISRNIAETEGKIEELQTSQSIANADKRREAKKKAQQKEFDDSIALIKAQGQATNDAEKFFIDQNKKIKEKAASDLLKSKQFSGTNMIAGTAVPPVLIQVKIDDKSRSKIVQDMDQLTTDISKSVETLGEDLAIGLGEALGNALSGQGNPFEDFAKVILGSIANFIKTVGKQLIAYGISISKFKTAFVNPAAAVAAGIAMVALGTAVSSQLKAGPSVPAFADGGIVSGPTLGLMGEYPGASSNPEVIAPLDKLKTLMKPEQSSGGFIASTTIQGRDLAIVLERYNKDSKRG